MGKAQSDAVFVFDEPTIGLHPFDVRVLLGVFDRLVASGATVVVIEHDLDVIANADWIIDMVRAVAKAADASSPPERRNKSRPIRTASPGGICADSYGGNAPLHRTCASRIAVHGADSWH